MGYHFLSYVSRSKVLKILVTGVAGFIGMHVANCLVERGNIVCGIDNLNDYYDVGLKLARLEKLKTQSKFAFQKCDVSDLGKLKGIFENEMFDCVVHLAAQAGVRYSITNPRPYISTNVLGFLNILECCRDLEIGHLVYASSSSVYGGNIDIPFRENQNVDHPISLYAASKKANELMAHTYSHLYKLPTTGLRFFTVYGPWGRPDMAPIIFTKAILNNQRIDVFNGGEMSRDFTYIDDIVDGVIGVLEKPATPSPIFEPFSPDPSVSDAPYRVFNIGNNKPTRLMSFISALEDALGKKAKMKMLPMQPGDVPATAADISAIQQWSGFQPNTKLEEGVAQFAAWYLEYYGVNQGKL